MFTNRRATTLWFSVCALLVAARLPYIWTGHIQEDAFIIFRTARNIADSSLYGFNPGERVSAVTSHAYVLVVALLRLVTNELFIGATTLLNAVLVVCASWLWVRILRVKAEDRIGLWAVVALTPVALQVSYSGMETGLLICVLALAVRAAFAGSAWAVLWCAALPWVRPDAMAFGLILVAVTAWRHRSLPGWETIGLTVGLALWLAFNRLYFDRWLTQSIVAKSVALAGERSPEAVFQRMIDLYSWYTMPIKTKYFDGVRVTGWVITWVAVVGALLAERIRQSLNMWTVAVMTLSVVLVPGAYAYGGVTAPWYLWPTTYFTAALVVVAGHGALQALSGWARRVGMALAWVVLVCLMVAQWAYSLNWGAQESRYRRGVGEYLREVSGGQGSLMLEPVGYIPYFSGLYVHDEVGMASPAVTEYRRRFGGRWWIRYLADFEPTYVVERDHIWDRRTIDGVGMSDEEWHWFLGRYRLLRTFEYDRRVLSRSRFEGKILQLGWVGGYHVFVRR